MAIKSTQTNPELDTKKFHISTGKELLAIKDRVRHLIFHWGEDGRYKEAVLKSVIQRFLPTKYAIATGFVVRQTSTRGKHDASNQIDLIIYDTGFPVLFKESDFVIVTPDSVRAIIEVKANLESQRLDVVCEKANRIGKFIYDGKFDKSLPFFNGIFSFDGFEKAAAVKNIPNLINKADTGYLKPSKSCPYKVNHICLNENLFYKYWEGGSKQSPNWLYYVEELAISFFIGNLMDYLVARSVMENANLWFPVDKTITVLEKF